MRRLFHLYRLWWLGLSHWLRHDLARELTFAVASLVLTGTFFYVFNDFLNVQVATLSAPMHQRFAAVASVILLLLTSAGSASWIRKERLARTGVRQLAQQLGEERATVTAWAWLHAATLLGLSHSLCWWVIYRWLTPWPLGTAGGAEAVVLAATAVYRGWPAAPDPALRPDPPLQRAQSLGRTLYLWRLKQLLQRNRAAQLATALSLAMVIPVALAMARGLPLFVAAASALAAGYIAAAALCLQLADDLPSAWTERGCGVTHDRFVATYTWLGATISGACAAATAGAALLGALSDTTGSPRLACIQALHLAAVAAVPGLIAPLLLFQIDGRRSGTNLLLLLIAALFIGTAVFAHWLGLALIPVLGSFALKSQAGRFYRA